MNIPKITATINPLYLSETKLIEVCNSLHDAHISSLRLNLSKCSNDAQVLEFCSRAQKIREYNPDIDLMLDLPFPYTKPRIQIVGTRHYDVSNGQILYFIYSDQYANKYEATNSPAIIIKDIVAFQRLTPGQIIYYDNGQCSFVVLRRTSLEVTVSVIGTTTLHSGKSISCNHLASKTLSEEYLHSLLALNPTSIALSFASSRSDVDSFRAKLKNPSIQIISKIESQKGIDNIQEISNNSDIMIGRGDMLLFSDPYQLLENELKIAFEAKKNQRRLYIATGILNSLMHSNIPSQADLIDLYIIMKLEPYSIIINADLAMTSANRVEQCLTQFCNHMAKT